MCTDIEIHLNLYLFMCSNVVKNGQNGRGEIIMITYEDALNIAKDRKEHIDNGTEYEKYYVFRSSKDDNYIGGYGHTPVVIAKEDGRILSVPEMIVEGCGDEIKLFEIQ